MFSLLLVIAAGLGTLALLAGTILRVRARHRRESVAPAQPSGDAREESAAGVAAGPQEVTREEVEETGREVGGTPVPLPQDKDATSLDKGAGEGVAEAVTEAEGPIGGEARVSTPGTPPRRPPEPIGRGGRPRTAEKSPPSGSPQPPEQQSPRKARPEVVCWKDGWRWIIGIEAPEDLCETSLPTVSQDGVPLIQDTSRTSCWQLNCLASKVQISWDDSEESFDVEPATGDCGYVVFRLPTLGTDHGRQVRRATSGSFLVVVPEDWERDENISGPALVAPEDVAIAAYRAHFFDLGRGDGSQIGFLTGKGHPVRLDARGAVFNLVGFEVKDASRDRGPLFGKGPPRIRASNVDVWGRISTIVVGEEGARRGRKGWRTDFSPDGNHPEQDLPPELAARQSGWYFLRFYDHGDDLLESLDFRFTTSLQDIRVGNHAPLPPVDGHGPVPVEFTHDPGCVVQPVDSPGDPLVMRGDEQATVCEIPPDAACDDLGFLVGRKGEPRVLVRVLAHRVWWALGDIGTCPSQWTDKAIALSRDLFLATSSHALWLRFPYPHWLDGVQVGFERKKARAYRIGVDSRELPIALRDFGDSTEVTNRHDECSLRVWIESDGRLIEGVLATLPSEAPPRGEPRGVGGEYLGLGRKKTATARAALRSGTGEITVNGAPLWQYFAGAPRRAKRFWRRLLDMDEVSKLLKQIDAQITVSGSTPTTMRQAGAAGHALARALGRHDMKMQNILRSRGFGGARVQKCFPLQSRVTASLREGQISCNDRLRDGDL